MLRSTRERPSPLPAPLDEVRPPEFLSPSRFADLLQCPLSVIHGLPEEELLPPHPLALLGGIIHYVMYAVRGMALESKEEIQDAITRVFEDRLGATEARLLRDPSTCRLVPLRRAVGRTAWRYGKARLQAWVSTLSEPSEHQPSRRVAGSPRLNQRDPAVSTPATVRIPIGSERPLKLPDYRLSGRPDRIEQDSDGVFHITDLKTGSVLDREGQPRGDYALQIRLYGLMVEKIDPNARVRLWLEGSERVEVPWNDTTRDETEELLDMTLSGLPAGRSVSADFLAREGPQCGRCRIRHRCPRYHSVAPTWWRSTSTTAPVAPFDTWGTLLAVSTIDERSYEVLIRDAAGRNVRISGLEEVAGLHNGDYVWFFDLEPSETLPQHGAFAHPHNFHGMRPSRAWSDALRLRIFAGGAD